MEKITAIYPRVSSKHQLEGTSLDYQEEVGIEKAKELNIPEHLIKVYREEGFSGEDIDRPKLNELREDIRQGKIERVIVLTPDRLSRNLTDKLIVCSELEQRNVELVFVDAEYADTPEGQLFFNMTSVIAQYELALIKKRTSRGIISAVKNGTVMPMGISPYGYKYDSGELIIVPEEAEFIKKIYQWYVYDRLSIREIGEKLYQLGAKPRKSKGGFWSPATIQKMLRNELYTGKYYYNKTKGKKIKGEKTDSGNPKYERSQRDREEWIEVEVPKIVDIATYSLAEEQREKNKVKTGNKKHDYLLKGLVRCGCCGWKYGSVARSYNTKEGKKYTRYYGCHKVMKGTGLADPSQKCSSKLLNANVLEDVIWNNFIYQVIKNRDEFFEKSLDNNAQNDNQETVEIYEILKKQLEVKNEEKSRITTLFKKGFIDENEMEKDFLTVEKEIRQIKLDMSKYETDVINVEKIQKQKEQFSSLIEQFDEVLSHPEKVSFKVKKMIINELLQEISIEQLEDGKAKIKCYGALYEEFIGDNCSQPLVIMNKNNQFYVYSFVMQLDNRRGAGTRDKPVFISDELKITS